MRGDWNGWKGKFVRVNLTSGKISVEIDDVEIMQSYIGARGVGIRYMIGEVDPKIDPFDENNKIIFATGPLTGLPPAGNRCYVITKSPLTGTETNSSIGGYFGAELKFAGYDFIIIEGKAKKPVYLWIYNDEIELRTAEHIWGKGTEETEEIIHRETDNLAHIAAIGPAGENRVRMACVITGGVTAARAAGRGGTGAIMGSKNLKAVVVRGTRGIQVADKEGYKKNMWKSMKFFVNPTESCIKSLREYGTIFTVEFANELGILPTRNFQTGVFEGAEKIGGMLFAKKYSIRGEAGKACFGCPAGCARLGRCTTPGFEGASEGPEYESTASLGSVTGVDNLEAIMKANRMCNDYGMDTISTGATIGCAMELFERGYIPEEDIGRPLRFGDADALVEMVEKMGSRKGFGKMLAEGSYRLAEKYGHPELSMSVKKLELPNYDPRGVKGQGLGFVTNNRGADHCRAEINCSEIFETTMLGYWAPNRPVDRFTTEGKAAMTKHYQDYCAAAYDSIGICYFYLMDTAEQDVVDLFTSATGVKGYSVKELLKTGERIFNLERMFNLKAGISYKDDTLPKRFLETPMPEGPAKGQVFELDKMLPEYYQLRGWDDKGVPTRMKLEELSIASLV